MTEPPTPDLRITRLEHRAMRMDTARLVRILGATRPQHTSQLDALAAWYTRFAGAMQVHHLVENDVTFPALVERDPSFADTRGELEEGHRLLADRLAAANRAIDRLAQASSGSWERDHPEAIKAARALRALLNTHLDHEEATAIPRFVSAFTAQEFTAIGKAARKRAGLQSLIFACPWALDHADIHERAQLLADQPALHRTLYHVALRPRYERLVGRLDSSPAIR